MAKRHICITKNEIELILDRTMFTERKFVNYFIIQKVDPIIFTKDLYRNCIFLFIKKYHK